MITIRVARLDEVRALQQAVLRPDGPLPGDAPPPDDARQVGAFDETGVAVGAASVMPATWPGPGALPAPTWQLRAMAVAAEHRGTGVGGFVLQAAEDVAADGGAASLWAAARVPALGFYAHAGWTVVGEEWIKPGVGPHRYVTLRLATHAPRLRRAILDEAAPPHPTRPAPSTDHCAHSRPPSHPHRAQGHGSWLVRAGRLGLAGSRRGNDPNPATPRDLAPRAAGPRP